MKKTTLLVMTILSSISCSAFNYFWVGNSGNWSDYSNHWSTTSGGNIFHTQVPQATDNVYFDALSFTAAMPTVTIDQTIVQCADMTWIGVFNTPTLLGSSSDTLRIYGSLTLATGMNFNFNGQVSMEAITGKTITTSGTIINASLTFNGIGGSWILQDALRVTNVIYLNNGNLNTNNKNVNSSAFYSNTVSARSLYMGASIFNLSNYNGVLWTINPTEMTLDAGTSTINGIGNGGSFTGGGFTYNDLFFTGIAVGNIYDNNTFHDVSFASDGVIYGSNTFHDVSVAGNATIYGNPMFGPNTFNDITISKNGTFLSGNIFNNLILSPGFTYTLPAGQIQSVGGNICAQGTAALPIRIQSNNAGTPAIILKPSGTICWDYVRVSDITATGGATVNAGLAPANSQDLGGNTGLIFTGGCTAVGCTSIPATCIPPIITTNPSPSSICAGLNAVFTVIATGTNLTYQWQVNPGAGFTNLNNTISYNGVTTNTLSVTGASLALNGFQYRCFVGSGTCTSTSGAATLTVNPFPIVTLNSATICSGQTAILTATGAMNYSWSTGATTNSIPVSPAITTLYNVMGTANGCSGPAVALVIVNPIPTVTVNSATICSGQTTILTATVDTIFIPLPPTPPPPAPPLPPGTTPPPVIPPPATPNIYAWSNGVITSSISVSPIITTTYTVTVTSNGCSNTAFATVTVNPLPTVSVNSPTILTGQTATLTTSGASTYVWSTGETPNSIFVSPATTATYTVTGTTNGCSDSAIATVTVNPSRPYWSVSDMTYSGIKPYNGSNDSVTTLSDWRALYFTLQHSVVASSNLPLTDSVLGYTERDSILSYTNRELISGTIPFQLMNIRYNAIKPDAFTNNQLVYDTINNILLDGTNNNGTPYQTDRMFALAPGIAAGFSKQVQFKLPSDLYITNDDSAITSIMVDFADGSGYRTMAQNSIVQINYSSFGEKLIHLKVQVGSTTYKSSTTYNIVDPSINPFSIVSSNCSSAPDFQIYVDATIAYQGVYGSGLATVRWGKNNNTNKFRKPLIFVEGIDFNKTTTLEQYGDFGWSVFTTGVDPEDPNDDTFYKLPDLLCNLYERGYDVVLLDFKDGATFMQRNAYVLVKLIQIVNNPLNKVTDEPLVVIGASMGGQVAKYALSYMENNNLKHCTREYVSFDSPHKGANIPLGLQNWIKFYTFLSDVSDIYLNKIEREATMQLMLQHIDPSAPALRANWLADLNNVGTYPKLLRKVAISNGSQTGVALFNAGEQLMKFQVSSLSACNQLKTFKGNVWSLPGASSFPQTRVFEGKRPKGANMFQIWGNVQACNAVCPVCIASPSLFYKFEDNFTQSSVPHYDNCPGGTRNTIEFLVNEIQSNFSPFNDPEITALKPKHAFIPTISALDVNTSNLFLNVSTNISANNPNPALMPFEAFSAPMGSSEKHVQVTDVNKQWSLNELDKSANRLQSPLIPANSFNNNGVFNYGRKESRFLSSVVIGSNGKLYVNSNIPTDYGVNTPPPAIPGGTTKPTDGSSFTLETCNCDNVTVTVQNNGQFILGSNATNNKATVLFHSGSKLVLKAGSKLIISDNSKVVIEEGATLIFEAGAEIQLSGNNAVLDLKGGLQIGSNATFTFTYPGTNSGYVKFSRREGDWWGGISAPAQITTGTNSAILLKGKNKNDKILEINQETVYIPNNLSSCKIQTGKVEFAYGLGGSRLSIPCPVELLNSSFIPTYYGSGNFPRGIVLWGKPNNIYGCALSVGVISHMLNSTNKLKISYSDISAGVLTYGGGVNFIYDRIFSWSAQGLQYNSFLNYCNSIGSNDPTIQIDGNPSEVSLFRTNINTNTVEGVRVAGSSLKIKCGSVKNAMIGLEIENNASLNMNTTMGAGNVDLTNSLLAIQLNNAGAIDLNNGYNKLYTGAGTTTGPHGNTFVYDPIIVGTMFTDPSCPGTIPANNNYWRLGNLNLPVLDMSDVTSVNCSAPVKIVDNSPSAFSPCGVIIVGGGGVKSLLDQCPSCHIINTPAFTATKVNEAALLATQKMDSSIVNGHKTAVGMFHEILKFPITNPNKEDQYIIYYSHRKMQEALATAVEIGQVPLSANNSPIAPEAQRVVEILDDDIVKAGIAITGYHTRLYSSIEKAEVYRLMNRRDIALTIFDDILTWVNSEQRDYISHWRCLTYNENQVLTGQVPKEDFQNLMASCATFSTRSMSVKSTKTEIENADGEGEVTVFPNPTSSNLSIKYDVSESDKAEFMIYDMAGKLLYSYTLKGGSQTEEINNIVLSNGIYLYKVISNDKIIKQDKLTIIK